VKISRGGAAAQRQSNLLLPGRWTYRLSGKNLRPILMPSAIPMKGLRRNDDAITTQSWYQKNVFKIFSSINRLPCCKLFLITSKKEEHALQ
jgi:hypothetical protein